MNIIDAFLLRYAKEYDFYIELAHQVATICETIIHRNGIRAIVTYRAKKPDSLKDKLIKRNSYKKYQSIEQIYRDIVDLSGVRIAIYFPGDREEIGRLIEAEFITNKIKKFPNSEQKHNQDYTFKRRFKGYDAVHYRVKIKEEKLEKDNKRFAHAQVEIQVASALMHAWAEVEHDLAYKPQIGKLSEEESYILDELNGIVLSGEIALERLQNSFKHRIASIEQRFNNHYELAALLKEKIGCELLKEYFMGNVDILLKFLQKTEMDNSRKIHMYLNAMDGIRESVGYKSIVDYFVDLMLNHNPNYYNQYIEAKFESSYNNPYISIQKQMLLSKENEQLNSFVERWVLFEKTIKALDHNAPGKTHEEEIKQRESVSVIIGRNLAVDDIILDAVKNLEKTRNQIIYGNTIPDNLQLRNAADSIPIILNRLAELASGNGEKRI